MNRLLKQTGALAVAFAGISIVHASNLDVIGLTMLRAVTTNINGAGIRVGQAEAVESAGTTNYEVNPGTVGQPTSLFTYFYSASPYLLVSSASTFPNSVGGESGHAGSVAGNFYGMSGGVATNVAHVDNYEANGFFNYYVAGARSI